MAKAENLGDCLTVEVCGRFQIIGLLPQIKGLLPQITAGYKWVWIDTPSMIERKKSPVLKVTAGTFRKHTVFKLPAMILAMIVMKVIKNIWDIVGVRK